MIDISYENRMNLAFDKPLEYKGIYIYPATLPYYSVFLDADDCLDVSRLEEKDINLIRLPYLEYLYEKAQRDENFKYKWTKLIYILNIVLKDQTFEIVKEDNEFLLKVYQRAKDSTSLDKEYNALKKDIIKEYNEKRNIEDKDITEKLNSLNRLKEKMFVCVKINDSDFEQIRQIIMLQNDIKSEHYSSDIEEMLKDAQKKLGLISKNKDEIDLEDLITAVSFSAKIKPSEMYDMTIRRFNRFLYITRNKDDYYLYKQLELSGNIELKKELPYWIKHFEPVGKYDGVLINNSSLLSSFKDGKI